MKLLGHPIATNPRRIAIYLKEKGIDLPMETIDVQAGQHKSPEFLAKNPDGKIPVLEMDDGSYLPESAAIIEYLEELHPEPPMIGADPESRARTRAVERMVALLIDRTGAWLHHSHPFFAERMVQNPAFAEGMKGMVDHQFALLERQIGDQAFLAGERPTVADCSLFALVQTCRTRLNMPLGEGYPRLEAWYQRFAERPSAAYPAAA